MYIDMYIHVQLEATKGDNALNITSYKECYSCKLEHIDERGKGNFNISPFLNTKHKIEWKLKDDENTYIFKFMFALNS